MKVMLKRIGALAGAILLAGLFIAAIVMAVTGAPGEQLMAVLFSIVFISILFYAMGLMTRVLKGSRKGPETLEGEEGKDSSRRP
ncbi:MAG: hypothetical protein LIP16_19140 [Clostridium sp.]|nr:hypothetical protein [Clostridium sp.]